MTSPKIGTALLALTLAFTVPGSAQAQNALTWFHTYTVPGNYVVGAVGTATVSYSSGLRTRGIPIAGVPANAEILAAFLDRETMWTGSESVLDGLRDQVKFRGEPVSGVKSSTASLVGNSFYGCSGAGNGQKLTMMRADVLRLLPEQLDQNGDPTGRRVVNDTDLTASSLPLHTVTLPDSGALNVVPQSAGASLLIIYQDPNPLTPLRSIVVYDGLYLQVPNTDTRLTIRGMVDAASGAAAKLTFIGGSGQANTTDQIFFGGTIGSQIRVDGGNPFPAGGVVTARAWSNPTLDLAPGTWTPYADPIYGDQVETKITHTQPKIFYDCLSTGAVVLSAATQDGEPGGGDGLPDKLEDVSGLLNPDGKPYPDLHAMLASSAQRDLFVEIGAMKSAGWDLMSAQMPTPGPHNHMPTPAVLKKVGDALSHPPVGHLPIFVHFDVGDVGPLSAYRALGGEYLSHAADSYLIQLGARGGEQIEEEESGRFPGYRGVVSWPAGYQFLAAAPVGVNGQELAGDARPVADPDCRRRFDPNRQGLFHYVLYAHARSAPKSEFPCLALPDLMGHQEPVDFPSGMSCGALDDNALYYTPKSVSGIAELPGRYAMVSLGLWDNAVGSEDMQANTTLHELGHNLNLWHGGAPPVFTGVGSSLQVFVQPNCRPNYLSIMSYLFQATGVKDAAGHTQSRLSNEVNAPINEQFLIDGPLGLSPDAPYTSWYAPKEPGTYGAKYFLTPATKHCDGTPIDPAIDPAVGMVRIDAASPNASVDWAGNGDLPQYAGGQDVNFDGLKSGAAATLAGYNDWDGIALNRLGAGHDVAELSLGLGLDFSGLDFSGL